jgi:ankyrin repeat protein
MERTLMEAILLDNLPKLETLVKNNGVDINAGVDNMGNTPLMYAIEQGKYDAFKKLLEFGADVNKVAPRAGYTGIPRDETALMVAAKETDERYTIDLIQKGANVNAQNKDGRTALMIAYMFDGIEESIRALLDAGANLEIENRQKQTVIYDAVRRASQYDDIFWLDMLFEDERTPNVNHQDERGNTPIMTAIDSAGLECIQYLISKGADLEIYNNNEMTPLFYAIEKMFRPGVFELLDLGAKTTINISGFNKHALIVALHEDPEEISGIVSDILDKTTDVNIVDESDDGMDDSPLILAIRNEFGMDIIERIIEKGANVNYKNQEGDSALLEAVYANNSALVKSLVDKGADVNVQNQDNYTPLLIAAEDGSLDIVETLIDAGANINYEREGGDTALLNACRQGQAEIASLLLRKGANPNVEDANGQTPLMFAVINDNIELAELLLEKGADKTVETAGGMTAMDYARNRAYPDMIALLLGGPEPNVEMWKGYTKADAEFFNPILENENNLNDQSICPFCLQYTEREAACKYMRHKCRPELRHERLYNLYRSSDGYVVWCAVCGRHCYGHGHFPLTNTDETVRPNLLPFKPGADVYDPKSCPLEGGGGPDEKIKRIDGLLRYICEVQEDVGKRSAKKVREELIEEAWKAASARAPKTVRDIRAAKKFNIPCGLPSVATAETTTPVSSDIPNPNPLPVKHDNAECVVELGVHDDGRPVYEFKHVQPDGSIFNHNDQYICAQDLEELLRNAGGMEDKCPIDVENCKGKLHPDELKEIYGENSDVYKNYRERFNEKNKVGGTRKKQSRRKTYRNKKFRGGADGTPIISKMSDAICALPEKKTAGRRTYKKKSKSKRSTRRR